MSIDDTVRIASCELFTGAVVAVVRGFAIIETGYGFIFESPKNGFGTSDSFTECLDVIRIELAGRKTSERFNELAGN